ncbi:MAG: hypothetical protein COV45_00410 [Deltaproteobacteria bacterium CG11_big_fil_rev_8_21_14_0_20_47_16]|nr:MAG: hypothetical protein COV45_00410 [Deltaproteobacteria bacterium CG11_big_fil_rev_8_21_14_0_20_47_16]
MEQDKRSLIAVVLSVAVMGVWYFFFAPHPDAENQTPPVAQEAPSSPSASSVVTSTTPPPPPVAVAPTTPPVLDSFDLGVARVELSTLGGAPVAWHMTKYLTTKGDDTVNMVSAESAPPLSTQFENANISLPAVIPFHVASKTANSIRYEWASADVSIIKTYTFHPDQYSVDVNLDVVNTSNHPVQAKPVVAWTAVQPQQAGGFLHLLRGPPNLWTPLYDLGGSVTRETSLDKLTTPEEDKGLVWAGVENRYFIAAIIPRSNVGSKVFLKTLPAPKNSGGAAESGIVMPELVIPPGGTASNLTTLYVGPKEAPLLRAMGVGLEKAIDYGWFSTIAVPILMALQFFNTFLHNYGLAIILLTIVIKLLLHPINKKAMKSMKAMKDLQPKIAALKEKYGNDRERLNLETMQLFKSHGVNPMGGCLPMLIQMPIYFALYRVLWNAIELYRAPFLGYYKDLSAPDPYFIGPVLLGIFMFLQQKLTPSASADPAQQKMMLIMPVMFTSFMLFLPAGLVLYILVNTVMGVVQQWMISQDIGWRDVLRGRFSANQS